MTLNATLPRTAKAARLVSVAEVKQLLRDAAFVLRMTRRVKEDILRDAAGPNRPAVQSAERTLAVLGA